ncbi:MAG: (E)-4-hydroxy-3-methylbut-2-enyl-diphosphate synthase [Puniceicoccales bacterium]|jgi:(E)-4-hydroxy-3-methylbut-2-enyl-diphosphate synthase|nr:(E)-4-hydroxy-3-methylbut-2-enyl-diphosphate synthase [Puniceicoccales bacterium]
MATRRRKAREIAVGNVGIGGNNPISIQSMTNIATKNVSASVGQIRELVETGCEIVRMAVTNLEDVKSFAAIRDVLRSQGISVPLVADVHFSPIIAAHCLKVADKVRINAGNFSDKILGQKEFSDGEFMVEKLKLREKLKSFFSLAKNENKPVRIGINHGSLAPRMIYKFGNSEAAMWESARECLEAAEEVHFDSIVLSFKSSDAGKMVAINRLACSQMDKIGWNFPLHLGVTESGSGDYARTKSAIGIGTLLLDGLGDTIRVSLTEDPPGEIGVAKNILQACGARRFTAEIIACPSCGRTSYNIQAVLGKIKCSIGQLETAKNLKIAVMGCAVNGIGEAGDADFAIVGNGNGTLSIYSGNVPVLKNISQEEICEKFLKIIKNT